MVLVFYVLIGMRWRSVASGEKMDKFPQAREEAEWEFRPSGHQTNRPGKASC
jgi:hypothetical protein